MYENNLLQFFSDEEGRVRYKADNNTYVYDYFLKDHLGNVRMVLTEQKDTSYYPPVTFEDANVSNEQLYYDNVDVQRTARPGSFYTSTSNGGKVQLLRKSVQSKGAGQLLKVMAGDKLDIKVDYYIPNATTNNSTANGLNTIINALTSIIDNSPVTTTLHGSGSTITSNLNSSSPFTSFMSPQNGSAGTTLPKAYLNIVFFDEQFKFVGQNSEAVQVSTEGSGQTIYRIGGNAKTATKNGFVYIYVSNESDNLVYFDNLQVTHERGPILEETHYYPFGLTMAGISSKAAGGLENKRKFNDGSELANKEFSDGSGLELYETSLRSLDPQLGRWWQIDSKPDYSQSLYSAMGNNPILYNDPLGDTTIYYNASGDLLYRSSDGNKNAVTFISDKNLEAFNSLRSTLTDLGVNMDGNLVNGVMRLFGESYDVQGMFNFVDGNAKDNPNTQTDIWKPTDGKGPLINEQSAAMENKGGIWTPNPTKTDNSPGSPFAVSLQGNGVTMHTHENEGRTFTQTWKGETKNGRVASGKASVGVDGDISGAQNKPGTALFQTAVSQKSIYFYNSSGVVLTVNRDVFNPKYFKK